MTTAGQRCGTCTWFKRLWPNSKTKFFGSCKYPIKKPLPIAYRDHGVYPEQGEKCKCYQEKE